MAVKVLLRCVRSLPSSLARADRPCLSFSASGSKHASPGLRNTLPTREWREWRFREPLGAREGRTALRPSNTARGNALSRGPGAKRSLVPPSPLHAKCRGGSVPTSSGRASHAAAQGSVLGPMLLTARLSIGAIGRSLSRSVLGSLAAPLPGLAGPSAAGSAALLLRLTCSVLSFVGTGVAILGAAQALGGGGIVLASERPGSPVEPAFAWTRARGAPFFLGPRPPGAAACRQPYFCPGPGSPIPAHQYPTPGVHGTSPGASQGHPSAPGAPRRPAPYPGVTLVPGQGVPGAPGSPAGVPLLLLPRTLPGGKGSPEGGREPRHSSQQGKGGVAGELCSMQPQGGVGWSGPGASVLVRPVCQGGGEEEWALEQQVAVGSPGGTQGASETAQFPPALGTSAPAAGGIRDRPWLSRVRPSADWELVLTPESESDLPRLRRGAQPHLPPLSSASPPVPWPVHGWESLPNQVPSLHYSATQPGVAGLDASFSGSEVLYRARGVSSLGQPLVPVHEVREAANPGLVPGLLTQELQLHQGADQDTVHPPRRGAAANPTGRCPPLPRAPGDWRAAARSALSCTEGATAQSESMDVEGSAWHGVLIAEHCGVKRPREGRAWPSSGAQEAELLGSWQAVEGCPGWLSPPGETQRKEFPADLGRSDRSSCSSLGADPAEACSRPASGSPSPSSSSSTPSSAATCSSLSPGLASRVHPGSMWGSTQAVHPAGRSGRAVGLHYASYSLPATRRLHGPPGMPGADASCSPGLERSTHSRKVPPQSVGQRPRVEELGAEVVAQDAGSSGGEGKRGTLKEALQHSQTRARLAEEAAAAAAQRAERQSHLLQQERASSFSQRQWAQMREIENMKLARLLSEAPLSPALVVAPPAGLGWPLLHLLPQAVAPGVVTACEKGSRPTCTVTKGPAGDNGKKVDLPLLILAITFALGLTAGVGGSVLVGWQCGFIFLGAVA